MKLIKAGVLFIFLCSAICSWGQFGSVVTVKSDTLRGAIKIFTYDIVDRLTVNVNGKKHSMTALQVRSFELNGQIYTPVLIAKSYRFTKLLKDGYLSLHAFRMESQNSYDGRYLKKMDGTGMEVPNLVFKKAMSTYLADCPKVVSRINSGELNRGDVESIIDLYNVCMNEKTVLEHPVELYVTPIEKDKLNLIKSIISKLEIRDAFEGKTDAMDILKDMEKKVNKKEAVPNYLIEGLKSNLQKQPDFTSLLENLTELLKK